MVTEDEIMLVNGLEGRGQKKIYTLTPVCLLAAGVSPLCHFGLLSLWRGNVCEFWGCWSFSHLWRLCVGPAETRLVPNIKD